MSKFSDFFKRNKQASSQGVGGGEPKSALTSEQMLYLSDLARHFEQNPKLVPPAPVIEKRCGALIVASEYRNMVLCTQPEGHDDDHWDGTTFPEPEGGLDIVAHLVTDIMYMKPRENHPDDFLLQAVKLGDGGALNGYETTIAILAPTDVYKEF